MVFPSLCLQICDRYLLILVIAPVFWMVSFIILYLSFVCYSLYDAVIVRAHSSRTMGPWWLVVVLLIVF